MMKPARRPLWFPRVSEVVLALRSNEWFRDGDNVSHRLYAPKKPET
jgi:hypothetical protein